MFIQKVLSQQLPCFGSKGAQLTVMCQVGSLMNLKALLRLKRLLAGVALYLRVLALLVALQSDLAATCVVTLLT